MLNKGTKVVKNREVVELKKSKSYDDLRITRQATNFHTSPILQATHGVSLKNVDNLKTFNNELAFNNNMELLESDRLKNEKIRASVLEVMDDWTKKQVRYFDSLVHTFNRTLEHQNFHEIVEKTEDSVIVRLLAYGSSSKAVECGNEKFHKICIYKAKDESEEDLYMISLIVEIKMSLKDYIVWKEKSKLYVVNKEKAKEAFSNVFEYTSKNPCSIIRAKELDVKKVHLIDPEAKLEKISFKLDPLEFYE